VLRTSPYKTTKFVSVIIDFLLLWLFSLYLYSVQEVAL
jgi:hypothetical protein